MDYSKAKKLHPNLKAGNVRRLIKAIRESEPRPGNYTMPPAESGGKPVRMSMMRMDGSLSRTGGKYPIYFGMADWIVPVRAGAVPGRDWQGMNGEAVCGTAACIAGFAYTIRARDAARKGTRLKHATLASFGKFRERDYDEFRIGMLGALGISASLSLTSKCWRTATATATWSRATRCGCSSISSRRGWWTGRGRWAGRRTGR